MSLRIIILFHVHIDLVTCREQLQNSTSSLRLKEKHLHIGRGLRILHIDIICVFFI